MQRRMFWKSLCAMASIPFIYSSRRVWGSSHNNKFPMQSELPSVDKYLLVGDRIFLHHNLPPLVTRKMHDRHIVFKQDIIVDKRNINIRAGWVAYRVMAIVTMSSTRAWRSNEDLSLAPDSPLRAVACELGRLDWRETGPGCKPPSYLV